VSNLGRSGIAFGAATTLLLSFSTQWLIVTRLGAGRSTDSYFAALAAPIVLLYVLGDPLNRVALPMLSVEKGYAFWSYAWTTLSLTLAVFVAIAVLLALSAHAWVPLLVPGFSASATQSTVDLSRILVVGMVFQAGTIPARAAWNARHRFLWPNISSVTGAAVALGFLFFGLRRWGVTVAAWAFDIRFGIECLLLVIPLRHYSRPAWTNVLPLVRKARPLVLGAAYFRTDVLVDRILTSMAPAGGLSLLYLAQQLLSAVGQVINQSVVTPSIPGLANAAHSGGWEDFEKRVRYTVRNLVILAAVLMLGLFFFGGPALALVFSHKAMGASEVHRLLRLLVALGGMLLADGVVFFAYSSFYSAGDTLTPTVATSIVYSIGIASKIAAFLLFGIVGLAIAISGYYLLNAVVLLLLLHRKLGRLLVTHQARPDSFETPLPPAPTPEVY
jgi:putative peptidoglycan lipid II flippase